MNMIIWKIFDHIKNEYIIYNEHDTWQTEYDAFIILLRLRNEARQKQQVYNLEMQGIEC